MLGMCGAVGGRRQGCCFLGFAVRFELFFQGLRLDKLRAVAVQVGSELDSMQDELQPQGLGKHREQLLTEDCLYYQNQVLKLDVFLSSAVNQ